jgi:hypothetical protein
MRFGKETISVAGFFSEYDNGSSGSSKTIDWNNGNKQKMLLTAAPCTVSFTNPPSPCNLLLKLTQDTGGSFTVTWPSMKWVGAAAPTLSTAAGSVDIVALYFDGTNYWGQASLNFATP